MVNILNMFVLFLSGKYCREVVFNWSYWYIIMLSTGLSFTFIFASNSISKRSDVQHQMDGH